MTTGSTLSAMRGVVASARWTAHAARRGFRRTAEVGGLAVDAALALAFEEATMRSCVRDGRNRALLSIASSLAQAFAAPAEPHVEFAVDLNAGLARRRGVGIRVGEGEEMSGLTSR